MGGSSGSQQPVTTSTTNSDPWSGAQPYISHGLAHGDYLFNNDIGYQPYTGQMQPDLSPGMIAGMGGNSSLAQSLIGGGPNVQAARQLGLAQMQNEGLSPQLKTLLEQQQGQNNPYLQSVLDANSRRVADKVNSATSGAGRYGSGAHTDVLGRSLAESTAPILAQDYQARQEMQKGILEGGLQRAGQWAQLTPTLDAAQYAPGDLLMGYGQYEMDRQRASLQDAANQYNAYQARPWEQLARFNAIVGGSGGLGGTKVTATTQPAVPYSNRILGGAAAGAGIGSAFGGLPGAGVGAAAGGLLGLL